MAERYSPQHDAIDNRMRTPMDRFGHGKYLSIDSLSFRITRRLPRPMSMNSTGWSCPKKQGEFSVSEDDRPLITPQPHRLTGYTSRSICSQRVTTRMSDALIIVLSKGGQCG